MRQREARVGGDGALQPVAGGQRVELVQPLEALRVEPRRVDVGRLDASTAAVAAGGSDSTFSRSRRRRPMRDTSVSTSASVPVSLTCASVPPARESCSRASSRIVPAPGRPIVTYEPRTTRSLPSRSRMRPSVSGA